MAKNSRTNFLLTVFILTLLSISSVYATLTPAVHAAEVTIQQKGLAISNNVVGIDTAKYTIFTREHPQESYLDVLPQQTMRYTFQANESKIDIAYTFVNGSLQMMHVLERKDLPITIKSSKNALEMAQEFLSSYQVYSGNSFYGELRSMLNDIDFNETLIKTVGNTKLDITSSGESSTFRWTYVYDGIEAPVKCVVLSYSNGFLKYFVDNWNLYKIGSTSINLSEKEATDDGLARAKNFSWKVGSDNNTYEIKDFKATKAMIWETIFSNSLSADTARDHDPLRLYPMRHVWVSLDKFYLGNVYGIEVLFWADTKELYSMQERFSTLDPPVELVANSNDTAPVSSAKVNSASISLLAIPILGAIALGTFVFWLGKKNLVKSKASKTGGILLCILLVSMLLLPISGVYASDRCSLVWGSRSSGAYDSGLGATWRKTSNELGNQSATAADINYSFDYYGDYSGAHNYQGSNSRKSAILDNISYSRTNYPFTAVVDFDHGVGNERYGYFHYMFEDDNGTYVGDHTIASNPPNAPDNGVYDYEVFSHTGGYSYQSEVYFAFINTCYSANITWQYQQSDGSPVGMPYAWTHRIVNWKGFGNFTTTSHMSMFGYEDGGNGSDNGDYCYIGFPFGSAALAQTSIQSGYTQTTYASFVQEFFAYALMYRYSVKDALDQASLMCFTRDFGSTDLYWNFTAIWPMWHGTQEQWVNNYGYNSTLAVYGNGDMYLREPRLTVSASDMFYGSPLHPCVYVDSEFVGTAPLSIPVSAGWHDVYVESPVWNEYCSFYDTFYMFSNNDQNNPTSVEVYSDTQLTAGYIPQ